MEVVVEGERGFGVRPKDVALAICGRIGTAGGTGYVMEYRGSVFRDMSIEGRLTVANMSIEAGARSGLFAPDEHTSAYLEGSPMAPNAAEWAAAVPYWKPLATDEGVASDKSGLLPTAAIDPKDQRRTN